MKSNEALANLASPASGPVQWEARVKKSPRMAWISAQTWAEARQLASIALQVEPDDLSVTERHAT